MLAHAEDWEGFRRAARCLLRAGVAPMCVHWRIADEVQGHLDLFGDIGGVLDARRSAQVDGEMGCAIGRETEREIDDEAAGQSIPAQGISASLRFPRRLLEALRLVMLHRAPERLHHIYHFLWRWQRAPALRSDPLDQGTKVINDYYREVRHDAHRMLGFVRFRLMAAQGGTALGVEEDEKGMRESREWRVAWHEPRHRVLRLVAPHFVRRFSKHRWAILTPDACVTWDTVHLVFHAGTTAVDAPQPDAGEALWLTYYANQFNAARCNPVALRRCMPTDYWKNLPEATLITALLARR